MAITWIGIALLVMVLLASILQVKWLRKVGGMRFFGEKE